MIITWYGEGCFRFQNGDTSLTTDFPDASSGLSIPRARTNIYLKTLSPWPLPAQTDQASKHDNADTAIFGPGEYDMQGIRIRGYELLDESSKNFFKTIYSIVWDDISIGILGHVSNQIQPAMLEQFEEIDMLIAPAGGAPFLDQKDLIKLVKLLNPKIYIPSFFRTTGLKRKTDDAKEVFDALNGGNGKPEEKFVFKKKDLAEIKKTKIVMLRT